MTAGSFEGVVSADDYSAFQSFFRFFAPNTRRFAMDRVADRRMNGKIINRKVPGRKKNPRSNVSRRFVTTFFDYSRGVRRRDVAGDFRKLKKKIETAIFDSHAEGFFEDFSMNRHGRPVMSHASGTSL